MVITKKILSFPFLMMWCLLAFGQSKVLNLYVWTGYFPQSIYNNFEKQTGIHVNVSNYGANEVMFTKLKAAGNPGYDLIFPSSYYIPRMIKNDMLDKIDSKRLSHYHNIDKHFLHQAFDPQSQYCIPYFWGTTGVFVNKRFIKGPVSNWGDFWQKRFRNQLLLLDDPREVFSMALMHLGYSANDGNVEHIKQAYQALLKLGPNIRLFNSSAVLPIAIDDDASIGMIWSGDYHKAWQSNKNLQYVLPKPGFVIWTDTMVIPKDAPDVANAYKFINYLLSAKVAASASMASSYTTTVTSAKKLLPRSYQESRAMYPSKQVFKRGQMQTDISNKALAAITQYWELLKINLQ